MGKLDKLTKEYMRDPERFADFQNVVGIGRVVPIDPKDLKPVDPEKIIIMDGKEKSLIRDVEKLACYMYRGSLIGVFPCLENEANIDFLLPIRLMQYDIADYMEQIRHQVEKSGKEPGINAGFDPVYKDVELFPVHSSVIYWNPGPYNGPRDLFDMMSEESRELFKGVINNYKINLFVPAEMSSLQESQFKTELRLVFGMMKRADNSEELDRFILENPECRHMTWTGAEIVRMLLPLDLRFVEKEGETVDMCKAIEEMHARDIAKGKKIGLNEGIEIGEKRGEKRGVKQGEANMLKSVVFNMLANHCTTEEILRFVPGCSKYRVNKLRREWKAETVS